MRYALVIPDGAADRPHAAYGGRTALAAADLPHFHRLAREGRLGRTRTAPESLPPGSDVCNLSLLGYDPERCYSGRAPLEAASRGLKLAPDEAVFRANTVVLTDGVMRDYAGGHITTAEAGPLIEFLDQRLDIPGVRLHPGVSYRHLCVVKGLAQRIPDRTPPHDLTGRPVAGHEPHGAGAEVIARIEARVRELLPVAPVNAARRAAGREPISALWLWGGGTMPQLEPFAGRYGVAGGLISAVDLLKGIAVLCGLEVIDVPGATGYYDTDYAGKARAALACLQRHRFVAVHVEAPDEASHNGHAAEKIKALENIDRLIMGQLLAEAERAGDLRILCVPDHATPLELRTHAAEPVPFALWGPGIGPAGGEVFTEAAAEGPVVAAGQLMKLLFAQ